MTNEQVIKMLTKIAIQYDEESQESKAIGMAIKSVEKQIPKKPQIAKKENIKEYYCANCNGYINNAYDMRLSNRGNNCKLCGQAIDWSDEVGVIKNERKIY